MKRIIIVLCLLLVSMTGLSAARQVVIALDAGHGGKDSGAVGQDGLQEKRVTLAIAKKLEVLLEKNPLFKPVLTRTDDRYISVSQRSDVARKQRANILISIHADAAPNRAARGASIWVLSNKRADSELGRWIEQHEKQSELLGGAGDALSNNETNPYLSQTVLDLQFAHAQRVGYDLALFLLPELKKVGRLHKTLPEHASLGVLRSPDIPSVLIEVGFISNLQEEKLLATDSYQNKIAHALYLGLQKYFAKNPLSEQP